MRRRRRTRVLCASQWVRAAPRYHGPAPLPAVAALKASLKPKATVKRDGQWQTMDAALLVPGDLVLLGSGSNVPADCFVNDGQIDVDQSAINGESLPATKVAGGKCLMGTTVVRGEVEATVEFTGKDTEFGKTAALIQLVGGIGHLQKLIMTIMIVLLCVSFVLCFASFGYLMGKKVDAKQAVDFTVIVLVASIPIAIEIVVTTTLALGSRQLATHGAIVTRLGAIEEMAGMNILCSDKTGEGPHGADPAWVAAHPPAQRPWRLPSRPQARSR